MWDGAVSFIQVIKSILMAFMNARSEITDLVMMSFMVTIVLSLLKNARYRENGG